MGKTLILTVDFGKVPTWAITAKSRQLSDWVELHKSELPFENIVIIPDTSDTKLFWLEGDVNDIKHIKELNDIRDKIKPILCAVVRMDIDKEDPRYKEAMKELKQLRDLRRKREK